MDRSSKYSDERLDKLLVAIGKTDLVGFIKSELESIRSNYSERSGQLTAAQRRLLRRFRASTTRRREMRRQLRSIKDDIVMAGQLRRNPHVDEHDLRASVHWSDDDLEGTEVADYAKFEADEDLDIAFLLDKEGDYRKRDITKLVVEPFLRFLERNDVVPSRALPLNRMTTALFDWLDIEEPRPTDVGIRTIASNMKRSRR
jgi:hypothetical protein